MTALIPSNFETVAPTEADAQLARASGRRLATHRLGRRSSASRFRAAAMMPNPPLCRRPHCALRAAANRVQLVLQARHLLAQGGELLVDQLPHRRG